MRARSAARAAVLVLAGCAAWLAGTSESALATVPWLGLNGNSVKYLGPVDTFSQLGVVYDRSFELSAGTVPSELELGFEGAEFERRLGEDHEYGMIPVSVIEYKGYDKYGPPFTSDPNFPRERTPSEEREGKNTIGGYVEGFVRSASRILELVNADYPGMRVLFEPMNEPWGYTTPQYYAPEYADVIARLLPAAKAAGIPLDDIYVAATGAARFAQEGPGEAARWNPAGWVGAMYQARPALASEVQGWYVHPYGPPRGTAGAAMPDGGGIESVPLLRARMTSGENNIVVSEVGFCDAEAGGAECGGSHYPFVPDATQAAEALTEMLKAASAYHEAGWLKALMVYSRNDGGWAMQYRQSGQVKFTEMGEALLGFAESQQASTPTATPAATAAPSEPGADGLPGLSCAQGSLCAALGGLWL